MSLTLPRGEAAVAAALAVLAAYVLWEAAHMPASAPGQPGPGFFPAILGIVLFTCGAVLLWQSWRTLKRSTDAASISFRYPRVWITLAALVAMAGALEPLGFVLAATLFLLVLLRFCGGVGWTAAGVGSIVLAVAAWSFFVFTLGVALPRGIFPL